MVFLELDLMNTEHNFLYTKIAKYCHRNDPFEAGGYVNKNFDIKYFEPLELNSNFFVPGPDFYLDIINKKDDILFCFHSHLFSDELSESDLNFVEVYDLPILVYVLDKHKFLSVNNKNERDSFLWNFEEVGQGA